MADGADTEELKKAAMVGVVGRTNAGKSTVVNQMVGEKVWVWLNDELVVDNTTLENYWDRSQPIFPVEQIELQCHGDPVEFRNIFIKEL